MDINLNDRNKKLMKNVPIIKIIICIIVFCPYPAVSQKIKPPIIHAEIWKDIDENPINAHGAGILFHNGIYYMFGEIKKSKTWLVPNQDWEDYRVPAGGVSCYSSVDLLHWKYEGVALASVTGDATNDLDTGKVIERPKVIYNEKTGKFV